MIRNRAHLPVGVLGLNPKHRKTKPSDRLHIVEKEEVVDSACAPVISESEETWYVNSGESKWRGKSIIDMLIWWLEARLCAKRFVH